MRIPSVTRQELLAAVEHFDAELRNSAEWADWEQYRNHKYAILHDGRRYPVKKIIRIATGIPALSFNGGYQANSYAIKRGFTVVSKASGHPLSY